MDERAAANLNEREFAFVYQRVERGGAYAAEVVPGFGDWREVPHVLLVAPRAQIEIFLRAPGTVDHSHRRRCWTFALDGFHPGGLNT